MNAWCRDLAATTACALACLAGLAGAGLDGEALAAPRAVEAFDAATWSSLPASLSRPAAVVFSTTDCVHCPAVIEQLRREIRARKLKAELIVVVMDVAPGDADETLRMHAEYRHADRLFAFAGQAAAIRYAVDPRWRGVTPYVSFLVRDRPAVGVTGPPARADIDAWDRSGSSSAGRVRP